MTNKKFLLGMLVMALVFGMMIVGCDEESKPEMNPSPPTGLAGTAISPTSVELTWNPVSNVDAYRIEYGKHGDSFLSNKKYEIKTASVIINDLIPATKYDFRVALRNTDMYASGFSPAITVETLPPTTGNVSITSLITKNTFINPRYVHTVSIILELSAAGSYWKAVPLGYGYYTIPAAEECKSWVTVTGINLDLGDDCTFQAGLYEDNRLILSYTITGFTSPIPISSGITVSIDASKLTEMKGNTNITDNLTVGTPSSASSSAWTN